MKSVSWLLKPITEYPVFFWMMVLMLFIPMYSWDWYNIAMQAIISRLSADVVLSFIITYAIFLLGCFLSRLSIKISKLWIGTAYLLTWLFTYVEVLMIKFFHTRYAVFVMQIVDETSPSESFEFFCGYFMSAKFLIITLGYLAIFFVLGIYLQKWIRNKAIILGELLSCIVASCVIICTISANLLFASERINIPFGQDSFSRFCDAYKGLQTQRSQYKICDLNHQNIEVDSCKFTSPKIILMIGESYIKRHTPLYGYNLQTTPYMSGLDSLFVFTDVVTSVNTTTLAIRNMLSLSSVGEGKEWYESPYFMAFFKKSGYHVSFYSNQYPKGSIGVDGTFLDQPILNEACFSFRNDKSYIYDGELLDHLEQDRSKLEVGEHWLTIIHFMGQHMMSVERYPEAETYFTADSINRPDLTESKRWEVAHYDNAMRYNDAMVGRVIEMYKDQEVIFVYLADHGDEVYDFRDFAGRNFDMSCGADMLHCHIDIPLFVYVTPLYRERHPDVINNIKQSVGNPFMSDDLPHLMLDLAGIYTPSFKPSKSPINPDFDKTRKRLIGYDTKCDYDSICSNN